MTRGSVGRGRLSTYSPAASLRFPTENSYGIDTVIPVPCAPAGTASAARAAARNIALKRPVMGTSGLDGHCSVSEVLRSDAAEYAADPAASIGGSVGLSGHACALATV